jgi:hypothetical protein
MKKSERKWEFKQPFTPLVLRESIGFSRTHVVLPVFAFCFCLLFNSLQKIEPEMVEIIAELRKKVTVGIVGGSDMPKQREQMGPKGMNSKEPVLLSSF